MIKTSSFTYKLGQLASQQFFNFSENVFGELQLKMEKKNISGELLHNFFSSQLFFLRGINQNIMIQYYPHRASILNVSALSVETEATWEMRDDSVVRAAVVIESAYKFFRFIIRILSVMKYSRFFWHFSYRIQRRAMPIRIRITTAMAIAVIHSSSLISPYDRPW